MGIRDGYIIHISNCYNSFRVYCRSRIYCNVWGCDYMRINYCTNYQTFYQEIIYKRSQQWLLLFRVIYISYNEKIIFKGGFYYEKLFQRLLGVM